jgi:hypothetical protein
LPASDVTAQPSDSAHVRPLLKVSEVQLSDFLDSDGLVLQLDDITLNQAKNHVWAEDLHRQIDRGLRARLSQQQQQFTIIGSLGPADLSLSVELDAFHWRYDGLALASGQWQLKNKQGEIQRLARFDFTTALNEPGYPALVRALGQNLDKLAMMIADDLSRIEDE